MQQGESGVNRPAEKLYPDAGASLIFEFSHNRVICRYCFNTETLQHRWSPEAAHLSIRLKPGATTVLLGRSFVTTINHAQVIDEYDLPGVNELLESLPLQTLEQRVTSVQSWLVSRLRLSKMRQNQGLINVLQSIDTKPERLAEALGMSRRTLERRMRNELGVTPNQMLSFNRIRISRELLLEGKESLSDIALLAGYYDQAHFTNLFHQATLESPAQYRRRKLSQISNTPSL